MQLHDSGSSARDSICLAGLLSVLLSNNKSADEKKKILEEEFGIAMTKTIKEEAEEMFDYGDYVEEMGRREGIREEKREGKREGIITSLKNLIKNANMPLEQAMAVLEIPEKDKPMYAGEIGKIL